MTATPASTTPATRSEIRFREFVLLCAALMAMNALSIDPMLPALPDISRDLHIPHPNDRQLVISVYFIGLGIGAMLFGVLSDRFGRKPVFATAICLSILSTIACAIADSFPMLLAGRACAGFFAASSRVITVSIVRDRFRGDAMARVMSLIFAVFMIIPVIAPSFGQLILWFAPWRWIFWILAIIMSAILLWMLWRLPETLPPQNRVPISVRAVGHMVKQVLTTRDAIGYMLAAGIASGGLVSFILSIQQLLFDRFHAGQIFPLLFAGIAGSMGIGSLANSRLVSRFGARRMSHGALCTMILLTLIRLGLLLTGYETLVDFVLLQAATMLTIAFTASNFSAISMEPFARGAGVASSFQACLTTIISAVLGAMIGAAYDGTTLPLILGILGFGLTALLVVLWAEHGRLFTRPRRDMLREPDIDAVA